MVDSFTDLPPSAAAATDQSRLDELLVMEPELATGQGASTIAAGAAHCGHHLHIPVARGCDRCSGGFCADCLVPLQGQWLCARCKIACLRDLERRALFHDRLAHEALWYSLVGSVICQVICIPVALVKAVQALRQHRGDSAWLGRWKAITAVAISCLWFLFLLVMLVSAVGGSLADGK